MRYKPTIPDGLTESDWKSKETIFMKVGGKTGISESLRQLKVAFDRVKWSDVAVFPALKEMDQLTPAGLQAVTREYQAARAGLVPLHQALVQVEVVATKTRDKYKKNPLVPAANLKAVETIISLAKANRTAWAPDACDREWKQYQDLLVPKAKHSQELAQAILHSCDEIEKLLKQTQASPTPLPVFEGARAQVRDETRRIVEAAKELQEMAEEQGALPHYKVGAYPHSAFADLISLGSWRPSDKDALIKLVLQTLPRLEPIRAFLRPH